MSVPSDLLLSYTLLSGRCDDGFVGTEAINALRLAERELVAEGTDSASVRTFLSMALLMHERCVRRGTSHWAAYLDMLPADLDELDGVLYWSEHERTVAGVEDPAELPQRGDLDSCLRSFTSLSTEIRSERAELSAMHRKLFTERLCRFAPAAFPPSVCSYDRFLWAHGIWWSRAMDLPDFGGALVPLADFMNHKVGALSEWRLCKRAAGSLPNQAGHPRAEAPTAEPKRARIEHAARTCIIVLGTRVATDEHVCINYGRKKTAEFALHYGFIPSSHAAACVRVPLWTAASAGLVEVSLLMLNFPPFPPLIRAVEHDSSPDAPSAAVLGSDRRVVVLTRLLAWLQCMHAASLDREGRCTSAELCVPRRSLALAFHQTTQHVLRWHIEHIHKMIVCASQPVPQSADEEGWYDELFDCALLGDEAATINFPLSTNEPRQL